MQELSEIARKLSVSLGQERQSEAQRGKRLAHIKDREECRGSTRREEDRRWGIPPTIPLFTTLVPNKPVPGSPGQQENGRA
jgi:hypothetical protein